MKPRIPALTEADIALAADTILRRGERPTIERLRLQIGRGSPNTLGPWLDNWFRQLAHRLDPDPGAHPAPQAPQPPPAVLAAALQCWEAAMAQAGHEAQARLADREQQVDAYAKSLEQQHLALQAREESHEEMRQHLQAELAQAQQQLTRSQARIRSLEARGAQDESQIATLGARLLASERAMADEQTRLAAALEAHQRTQQQAQEAQARAARAQGALDSLQEHVRQESSACQSRVNALSNSLQAEQERGKDLALALAELRSQHAAELARHQAQTEAMRAQAQAAAERERLSQEHLAGVQAQLSQLLAQSELRDRAIVGGLERLLATRKRRRGEHRPDAPPEPPVDETLELK